MNGQLMILLNHLKSWVQNLLYVEKNGKYIVLFNYIINIIKFFIINSKNININIYLLIINILYKNKYII